MFGVCALCAGLVAMLLHETGGRELPYTIEQAETLPLHWPPPRGKQAHTVTDWTQFLLFSSCCRNTILLWSFSTCLNSLSKLLKYKTRRLIKMQAFSQGVSKHTILHTFVDTSDDITGLGLFKLCNCPVAGCVFWSLRGRFLIRWSWWLLLKTRLE